MTLAYWCVLVAAALPYVFVALAKFWGNGFRPEDNLAPRIFLAKLEGWRQRANWAQHNGYEAFAPFAAAVIIAHQAEAPQDTVNALALGFIAARVAHGGAYLANIGLLRSLLFFVGIGCVVGLFVVAA